MRQFGVVGDPIAHSLSPLIHQAFAAQFGHAIRYQAYQVVVDDFPAFVANFFADGGAGLNITVPHKQTAANLAGSHLPACNTFWMDAGALRGTSTDGEGLLADFAYHGIACDSAQRVLLLGAGGSARTVFQTLSAQGAHITVANRTLETAKAMIEATGEQSETKAAICPWDALADTPQGAFDLIINTTSATLHGQKLPLGRAARGAVCYDLAYPLGDAFVASCEGAVRMISGEGMLVEQAARSYQIWYGVMPDAVPVRALLHDHLTNRPNS